MNLSLLLGILALAAGVAHLVWGLVPRKEAVSDGSTVVFVADRRHRIFLTSGFWLIIGAFSVVTGVNPQRAWPLDSVVVPLMFAFAAVGSLAIARTNADRVVIGPEGILTKNGGSTIQVPWQDYTDVVSRGPYQLEVLVKEPENYLRELSPTARWIREHFNFAVVYINTGPLRGGHHEVLKAIRDASGRYAKVRDQ